MAREKTLLKPSQLRLRDVVRLDCENASPFNASVVIKIQDGKITLFRPYATTADFETTSGVIPYIGIEQYEIIENDSRLVYELLERPTPPR